MSDISFIKGASGSVNFKTETYLILMIFMLSERFNLYITGSRTLKILKNFNLVKFSLLLGLVIRINIIFVLGVLYKRYTLSFFLRVGSLTLLLLVNFFIILLKNTKFYLSLFYNLWISFIIVTVYGTNSSHFFVFIEMLALNSLFMKNGVLLVVLCSDVLYASILMGNNLT